MEIYLTVITTVLVLTQIIRLCQNYLQLRYHAVLDKRNDEVLKIWRKAEKAIDKLLEDE